MGALARPDIPPGPQRELNDALHDLHHHAGWPSLRTLARHAGCSPTTVSAAFSTPRLPSWGLLELLVEAMGGDTTHFHQLWLTASNGDGTRATGPPAPPIAGRRAELATVRRHLETGTGLLLVTGEAGIGKTTLVSATTTAVAHRALVATGHCLPLSRQAPLLPAIDVLRDFRDAEGGRRFESALASCPGYVNGVIARLLPELGADPSSEPPDDWGRSRLLGALGALFRALAAGGRAGIVLEDLHWADPSTIDLVEHLVTRSTGLPIVGTWRLHDPGTDQASREWLTRMRRLPGVTELEVGPLTRDETATQLTLLLGDAAQDHLDSIWARAQGQPLFAEQLAVHPAADGRLPPLLADLIDARLGGLAGPPWSVARALGVADRSLPVTQLSEVVTLAPPSLTTALRTLAARRLITTSHDGLVVGLAHPLIAEGVRRRLVPGEGADTHRRLATTLGRAPNASPAEVAEHCRGAGDATNELRWRVRAAQDARSRSAPLQEADHWLRALELWPDAQPDEPPLSRGTVELAVIDALENAGHEDAGLARALSLLEGGHLGREERFRVAVRAASYTWGQHGPAQALRLLDDLALEYADEPDLLAGTLPLRANLLVKTGSSDSAVSLLEAARDIAVRTDDRQLLYGAWAGLTWHLGFEGDLAGARRAAEHAEESIDQEWGPRPVVSQAMRLTDVLLIHARPAEEVVEAGRRALGLIDELDMNSTQSHMVRANVAEALVASGAVARAAELLRAANVEPDDYAGWPLRLVSAAVDIARGDTRTALRLLETPHQSDAFAELSWLNLAAEAHLWSGHPGTGLELLVRLLEDVLRSLHARIAGRALVTAARAAADTRANPRDWHQRLTRLRREAAVDPLGHGVVPGTRPGLTATWEAELCRLDGSDTLRVWADAAAEWDRLAHPHDAAYCRWRAAQVALRDGQATVAGKLLRRAARDAREHVPLSGAIAEAAAYAQGP